MIFNEAYDYLFSELAGAPQSRSGSGLKDYQRKRLRRALLARSIKPYFLEASWIVGISEPSSAPVAALGAAGVNLLTLGNYSYKVTFTTAGGETAGSSASNVIAVNPATQLPPNLSAIPVGPLGTTSRKVYRTIANGGAWFLAATIADNVTTILNDNVTDAALGAAIPTQNTTGDAGNENVASTQGVLKPLIVLDGAIRTTSQLTNPLYAPTVSQMGSQADRNNFELRLFRTAGNSRVQIQDRFIKDEFLLTPAQAAIKPYVGDGRLGQGAPHPLTWPVPLRLRPNELIQVQSKILAGDVPGEATTFCQFRAVMVDNDSEDDAFIDDLRKSIVARPVQRPFYLSLQSENAKSIAFPAAGLLQRTVAKTREAPEHLLVLGYATLFARSVGAIATGMSELGSTCSPKWRLQSSNGHAFSKEEIDINTYAYARPDTFWQEFPRAFLLPKGCSLSASFSTLDTIADATEQLDNYVIFRCVTV